MTNRYLTIFLLFVFITQPMYSQEKTDKLYNTNKENVAVSGYDVVAYFIEEEPIEGDHSISSEYQGVIYWFANEENKAKFNQSPDQYKPQYGGWCAYAMGKKGDKVTINPKAYSIEDGKLYLFYKKGVTDTLKRWQKNTAELKSQANSEWSQLVGSSSNLEH